MPGTGIFSFVSSYTFTESLLIVTLHNLSSGAARPNALLKQTNIVRYIAKGDHWLVGCFGLNGPLRQYFSLYRAVSQREGERKEN